MSPSPRCYLHPRRDASLDCEVCARPICNACVQNAATRLTCPACLDDARRGGRWGRTGIALAMLLGIAALAGWFVMGDDESDEATLAEGTTKRYVAARLEAEKDPDDPEKWLRVAEILLEEHALAAARAPLERAVALDPDDAELKARLGYYEYEVGNEARALAVLEEAQALGADDPALTSTVSAIRERLADEDAEQQALAEARQATEIARARAERARAEAFEARAEAITESDRAEAAARAAETAEANRRLFEAQACSMAVERRGSHFVVPVQINGVEAELLYDTGASGLMLSHALARTAGVELDPGDTLEAQTANGTAYFLRADVETLGVAGGVLEHVRCAVCRAGDPCLGSSVDGLLGIQVMEAMGMTLDAAASRIRFARCD